MTSSRGGKLYSRCFTSRAVTQKVIEGDTCAYSFCSTSRRLSEKSKPTGETTPEDDLESLGYCVLQIMMHRLPWEHYHDLESILYMKNNLVIRDSETHQDLVDFVRATQNPPAGRFPYDDWINRFVIDALPYGVRVERNDGSEVESESE